MKSPTSGPSFRRYAVSGPAAIALITGSAIGLLLVLTSIADRAPRSAGIALARAVGMPQGLLGAQFGQFQIPGRGSLVNVAQLEFSRPVNSRLVFVNDGGVVNAASFARSGPVAPGSIAALFGSGLGQTSSAMAVPLPTTMAGSYVVFGNIQAPLFYTSSGQINFQVPWELAGQTLTSIEVQSGGSSSLPVNTSLAAMAPGIFTTGQTGYGQAAVLIGNTAEFAAPAGSVPGASSRPVDIGESISIYCTGLGPVTNQPATGTPAPLSPPAETITTPQVFISGVSAPVSFSGLTPGMVGLYQVNAEVPGGALSGDAVPLVLTIGGTTSNSVTIAVQ